MNGRKQLILEGVIVILGMITLCGCGRKFEIVKKEKALPDEQTELNLETSEEIFNYNLYESEEAAKLYSLIEKYKEDPSIKEYKDYVFEIIGKNIEYFGGMMDEGTILGGRTKEEKEFIDNVITWINFSDKDEIEGRYRERIFLTEEGFRCEIPFTLIYQIPDEEAEIMKVSELTLMFKEIKEKFQAYLESQGKDFYMSGQGEMEIWKGLTDIINPFQDKLSIVINPGMSYDLDYDENGINCYESHEIKEVEKQIDSVIYSVYRDDRSEYNDDGTVKTKAYYDRIILEGEEKSIQKINKALEEHCEAFFEDRPESRPEEGYFLETYFVEKEVMQNGNGYISIKGYGYAMYAMGAHGSDIISGETYNLSTGEEVKLTDLFEMEENELNQYLHEQCFEYVRSNAEMFGWGGDPNEIEPMTASIIEGYDIEDYVFYLKDNVVYLYFEGGRLGAYGLGTIKIPIALN